MPHSLYFILALPSYNPFYTCQLSFLDYGCPEEKRVAYLPLYLCVLPNNFHREPMVGFNIVLLKVGREEGKHNVNDNG